MSKIVESSPATAERPTAHRSGGRPRRTLVMVVALFMIAGGAGCAVDASQTHDRSQQGEIAAIPVNGKIAFATGVGGRWQIVTVNGDGTAASPLTDLATNEFHPAWSPDGSRIAFDAQSGGGEMQIRLMDADGSNPQVLTEGPGWNYLPTWSPDGARIAFVSNRDGNDEIYVMNVDGSGQQRPFDPERRRRRA